MKDLIVLLASIMLGIFIFRLIAGSQSTSTYSALKGIWSVQAKARTMQDY